ncbi:MAG: hypothetical protein IKZ95_09775 [Lachnospiraceae bacterium]|nr:hypothetical protein [Lachnospiraceae bacterium]
MYEKAKKLFTSEILALIAGICTVIAAIGALAVVGGREAGGILLLIFGLAALVLAIIAYIMMLVGLKRAGHDENRFNQAFIVGSFVSSVAAVLALISGILSIIYYILFIIYLGKSKKMLQLD